MFGSKTILKARYPYLVLKVLLEALELLEKLSVNAVDLVDGLRLDLALVVVFIDRLPQLGRLLNAVKSFALLKKVLLLDQSEHEDIVQQPLQLLVQFSLSFGQKRFVQNVANKLLLELNQLV